MTMQKKYIEDENGNKVLPITHFSAVRNSSGDTLEDVLYTESTYDPTTYSGMGRKVLQKNMVNGVNTLTQDMMPVATGGNTIYIIRYDFTLGEDITVPTNCVLEFDGGSISASGSNDTITGNNTGIQAGLVKIFDTNVTLAGTWNVSEAYPEWLGAKGDGISDDTLPIQKTISLFNKIIFSKKTYLTNELYVGHRCIIEGSETILKASAQCESVLAFIANNCTIRNVEIRGENISNFGITVFAGQFSVFENIKVTYCKLYGIAVLNASTHPISNNEGSNANFIHWKNIDILQCGNTIVKSGLTITSNTVTFNKSILNTEYSGTFRELQNLIYIMSDSELNGITNVEYVGTDIRVTLFRTITDSSTVELRVGGGFLLYGPDANCMTFENLSVAGGNSGIRQETSYGSTFIQSHIGGCYIDINLGYFNSNYCPPGNVFINTYHETYGASFYKVLAIGGYAANVIFFGGFFFTKEHIQEYSVNPAGYGLHAIGVYSTDTFE